MVYNIPILRQNTEDTKMQTVKIIPYRYHLNLETQQKASLYSAKVDVDNGWVLKESGYT